MHLLFRGLLSGRNRSVLFLSSHFLLLCREFFISSLSSLTHSLLLYNKTFWYPHHIPQDLGKRFPKDTNLNAWFLYLFITRFIMLQFLQNLHFHQAFQQEPQVKSNVLGFCIVIQAKSSRLQGLKSQRQGLWEKHKPKLENLLFSYGLLN